MSAMRKEHPMFKIANASLVDLPAPSNLSSWWNFGSLLGLCLGVQLVTGLMLAMHYSASTSLAFSSVVHITQDVSYGWLIRNLHANGASMFFLCLYLHVGRGIYYGSFVHLETWNIGIIIMFLVMATAFMGYVLPWGQMSFWGATVITNLLSAIPYIGKMIVEWLWGGFSVDNATLTRFYGLHFLLPFVLMGAAMVHLLFLHQTGSNNPLGLNSDSMKIPFHSYYSFKDIFGMAALASLLFYIATFQPVLLGDAENFIPANPLITPIHIKPEWYFLWAYAILRSIPNKLGGVVAMVAAILILFLLPYLDLNQGMPFSAANQSVFWLLVAVFFLLTWIGGCPVEDPYSYLGQVFTLVYFGIYLGLPITPRVWAVS